MINQEPKLTQISDITVSGISIRTTNHDEFNKETAKLSHLWQRFLSEGIAEKIPCKIQDSPIYGVYSDYESDFSGFYTVTAGCAIDHTQPIDTEFNTLTIYDGHYLVFSGQGNMPQVVSDTWKNIWTYFESATRYKRNYITDFELWRGADEIEIYIGVDL